MPDATSDASPERPPKLYNELAGWFPLLTPVADYANEAAYYLHLFETHARRRPRTLLELGSGGGHTAAHLKAALRCTLVDLSPAMLAVSRALNPECEHLRGDMRSLDLGRSFDCVLLHDAVSYMTCRDDLARAAACAFAHTAPGGVALFQPDFVQESFSPGAESGGSDGGDRALRYLEWRWDPDPADTTYVTDLVIAHRDAAGELRVVHDRHVMGLFPRAEWLEVLATAGFSPLAVPFAPACGSDAGHELFLGLRPDSGT